jgi:hypothetical protein
MISSESFVVLTINQGCRASNLRKIPLQGHLWIQINLVSILLKILGSQSRTLKPTLSRDMENSLVRG